MCSPRDPDNPIYFTPSRLMRWAVAQGSYDGWNTIYETDCAYDAVITLEYAEKHQSGHVTHAIFDDEGEGEPLCGDTIIDRLDLDMEALEREHAA